MAMLWVMMSALCLFALSKVEAQTQETDQDYTLEAASTENPDGTLTITANSPRPLWQALNMLYSKYGIEVDYEDPHYSNDQLYGPSGIGRRLRGGKFTATIPLNRSNSAAQKENMLSSLVKQYNDIAPLKFKVYFHKSEDRVDVIPDNSYQQPLLSTPVVINGENLSVEDVVNQTTRQVAIRSGNCLERAGIIDNSLAAQKASFKSAEALPAREVLAQVLDELEMKKIWLVTYDPQSSCFHLGVFNAQQLVDNRVRPVPQTHITK